MGSLWKNPASSLVDGSSLIHLEVNLSVFALIEIFEGPDKYVIGRQKLCLYPKCKKVLESQIQLLWAFQSF